MGEEEQVVVEVRHGGQGWTRGRVEVVKHDVKEPWSVRERNVRKTDARGFVGL